MLHGPSYSRTPQPCALVSRTDVSRHNPGASEAAEEMVGKYTQVSWTDVRPPSFGVGARRCSRLSREIAIGTRRVVRKWSNAQPSSLDPSIQRSALENIPSRKLSAILRRTASTSQVAGVSLIRHFSSSRRLKLQPRPSAERLQKLQRVTGTPGASGARPVADRAPSASHFLLYLNRQTHAGSDGAALAREIRHAWDANMKIVIIHERDPARGGCEFRDVFLTTPQDLIDDGLYRQLAVPFEGGAAHREVSRALLAEALDAEVSKGLAALPMVDPMVAPAVSKRLSKVRLRLPEVRLSKVRLRLSEVRLSKA
jgi:hypothetical protein